jgi:hypothetical protein
MPICFLHMKSSIWRGQNVSGAREWQPNEFRFYNICCIIFARIGKRRTWYFNFIGRSPQRTWITSIPSSTTNHLSNLSIFKRLLNHSISGFSLEQPASVIYLEIGRLGGNVRDSSGNVASGCLAVNSPWCWSLSSSYSDLFFSYLPCDLNTAVWHPCEDRRWKKRCNPPVKAEIQSTYITRPAVIPVLESP